MICTYDQKNGLLKHFVSAQKVIQMDDKLNGKLIGKGTANSAYASFLTIYRYQLNYTVSITVKDNRYRYEISQISVGNPGALNSPIEAYLENYKSKKGSSYKIANQILGNTDMFIKGLITSLKFTLANPPSGVKNKDDF